MSGMTTNIHSSFIMFSAMVTKLALLNVSMIQQDIALATMLLLCFVIRVSISNNAYHSTTSSVSFYSLFGCFVSCGCMYIHKLVLQQMVTSCVSGTAFLKQSFRNV